MRRPPRDAAAVFAISLYARLEYGVAELQFVLQNAAIKASAKVSAASSSTAQSCSNHTAHADLDDWREML